MNTVIRTLSQVQQAQADAWVYGLAVAAVAFALAVGVAFIVNWRSDQRDYTTRRIWFIVIGLCLPLAYWLYNTQSVAPRIQNVGFRTQFQETNLYVLLTAIGAYFAVSVLVMLFCRTSKFGSILGKKK